MPKNCLIRKIISSSQIANIPDEWQWILNVIDEAHLPKLGLPVQWKETAEKHQNIAYNPQTNETYNLKTGKVVDHKKSPVGYIQCTKDKHPMPGTSTPAAVRYERFDGQLQSWLIKDAVGKKLVPCIAHGDFVLVESLEADHLQAKAEIRRRQIALVKKLNEDEDFAQFIIQQKGMDKFFVQYESNWYGTLFFYELYFNDIDNVWLICDACNLQKQDSETINWLGEQWLYGQEFLDYLGEIQDEPILAKAKNKKGLAETAIEWFWTRHANYISVAKRLLECIHVPIQILNQKIDHVLGSGNISRANRLQASLDFKLKLMSVVATATGVGMPKRESESEEDSSDTEARLPVQSATGTPLFRTPGGTGTQPTVDEYRSATNSAAEKAPDLFQSLFKDEIQEQITARKVTNKHEETH